MREFVDGIEVIKLSVIKDDSLWWTVDSYHSDSPFGIGVTGTIDTSALVCLSASSSSADYFVSTASFPRVSTVVLPTWSIVTSPGGLSIDPFNELGDSDAVKWTSLALG